MSYITDTKAAVAREIDKFINPTNCQDMNRQIPQMKDLITQWQIQLPKDSQLSTIYAQGIPELKKRIADREAAYIAMKCGVPTTAAPASLTVNTPSVKTPASGIFATLTNNKNTLLIAVGVLTLAATAIIVLRRK